MTIKSNKVKINVWQMGYTTFKDYVTSNKENAKCVNKGYVLLDSLDDNWDESVWHFLNWSCWNTDDKGNAIKPESVQSSLDHCNSDIILNIDGTNTYKYAKSSGFGEATSLKEASKKMINDFCNFWPFPDVEGTSGSIKHEDDKVYQFINDEWIEITW